MADTVTLIIDGQEITVPAGTTILEAAKLAQINIPVICYHEATTSMGLCRLCVVDVDGGRLLQPACITLCSDGITVETHSERVIRVHRTLLEMLDSAVDLSEAPAIQALMDEYGVDRQRFPGAQKREHPVLDDNPFFIRDYSQCVLCWRCVQVCAEDAQYVCALTFEERGFHTRISTAFDDPMPDTTCVFCGQCVGVCPTGALKPKIEWGLEQGWSAEKIRKQTFYAKKRRRQEE
jgi:NADH dehydrogenase/NADH:ubiquinone oxidoreductase subunit G